MYSIQVVNGENNSAVSDSKFTVFLSSGKIMAIFLNAVFYCFNTTLYIEHLFNVPVMPEFETNNAQFSCNNLKNIS